MNGTCSVSDFLWFVLLIIKCIYPRWSPVLAQHKRVVAPIVFLAPAKKHQSDIERFVKTPKHALLRPPSFSCRNTRRSHGASRSGGGVTRHHFQGLWRRRG
ncbi:hypothetical protein LZ30DRAFT_740213 [Colletotrichum cereale]|nr:hypothetical protein LZ30DRAFT_740213 [Colletotrichum cereale]